MSLLTHRELLELVESEVLEHSAPEHVNAASIDIHMGDSLLEGDFQLALISATPTTLSEIQGAWSWMLDNIHRNIRGDWRNYERHCQSFKPSLEDCPNEF